MFHTKKIRNKTVYYSDILPIEHFFTSRDLIVKNNIDLLCDYLKVKTLIKPNQVHSANVEVVEEGRTQYPECDGLILDKKDTAIYLNFADCTPVILYDEKKNIAAVVHAGWRGTAQKIVQVALDRMQSDPNDIIAVIGPCIGFECFETSQEALEKLSTTVDDNGLFKGNCADLKGINKRQLELAGVRRIDICPYCTVCDNDKFFSYRKENKTPNRHSAVIKLQQYQP